MNMTKKHAKRGSGNDKMLSISHLTLGDRVPVASKEVPVASRRVGVASKGVRVASERVLIGSKFAGSKAADFKSCDIGGLLP